MQLRHTKAAFTLLWLLAVALAALLSSLASASNWIVLAVFSAIPPAMLWWLWTPPMASMSDDIRKAMRD